MARSLLFWDWEDQVDIHLLGESLAPFGVRVYEDPGVGDGSFGFILADEDLSEEEVRMTSEDLWGRPPGSVPPSG